MVTTRFDVNRGSQNARNIREEGNSNDPQLTLFNERMEQMAKSFEDLANRLGNFLHDPRTRHEHDTKIQGLSLALLGSMVDP
jgi:hypothetical protein